MRSSRSNDFPLGGRDLTIDALSVEERESVGERERERERSVCLCVREWSAM